MTKRIIAIVGVLLVLLGAIGAFLVFRAPEEASAPIKAIPISTNVPAATTAPATAAPALDAPTATSPSSAAAPIADTALIFEIVPAESEARFVIDEVLRGSPKTVIGATDQVAGQIALHPTDPTKAQVGVIQVNARTLTTDNNSRNRAIKNVILRTNEHEYVTFAPTQISGLPSTGAVGETYTFQITGDLTVAGVTKPVTFDVTVTPVSEMRLEGSAATKINYKDFGLLIPDSPSVDTVADDLRLELSFVAQKTT